MIVAAPAELTLKDGVFSCRVDSETLEVCDEDQPEDAIEVTASSPTISTIALTVPIRRRISDSTLVLPCHTSELGLYYSPIAGPYDPVLIVVVTT